MRELTLLPAIDLRGGYAVRLERGDPARETRYDADPVARVIRSGTSIVRA